MAKKDKSSEKQLKDTLDRIREENKRSQAPEYEGPEREKKK